MTKFNLLISNKILKSIKKKFGNLPKKFKDTYQFCISFSFLKTRFQEAKNLIVELTSHHAQSTWRFRGERVWDIWAKKSITNIIKWSGWSKATDHEDKLDRHRKQGEVISFPQTDGSPGVLTLTHVSPKWEVTSAVIPRTFLDGHCQVGWLQSNWILHFIKLRKRKSRFMVRI